MIEEEHRELVDPEEEERKFYAACLDLIHELREQNDTRAPMPWYPRE